MADRVSLTNTHGTHLTWSQAIELEGKGGSLDDGMKIWFRSHSDRLKPKRKLLAIDIFRAVNLRNFARPYPHPSRSQNEDCQ
ncbi:hypothetical protein [Chamaesiphon minutus]|uniref:Uncharacterized protein n=1 Tax=Chamaesiphon minutus (strain ATCC 27169 / PCC 6605) TaxID=1173020 RepID=K9UMD2_CHAP6|nr:hypothetical protein [Chamaesiphon minutus]AFY95349.1 hypothetical protein Cha6605_4416 [Chamaesiphon minutus PCC 6605]